ncbi:MAG: hypothetical protein C0609_00335 [Deltaproteobacteria bacterium]|nr:MAG: hypothetical protein C0609_00335 [Deltaproteobacteria bacterium]
MKFTAIFLSALLGTLLFAALPEANAAKSIFRGDDGSEITLSTMVEELSGARVIVMGERHNSPDDHTAQRTLIQALVDSGSKVALSFEMFERGAQPLLDRWIEGTLDEESFANLFASGWNPRWYPLYHGIFYYARQEGLPMVALNIAPGYASAVYKEGISALPEEFREEVGTPACDISEEYKGILSKALGGKPSPGGFTRFCQAQVLRDLTMASAGLDFLRENEGYLLVMLTGNYHAWRLGIPEQIKRIDDGIAVKVVMPTSDATFNAYDLLSREADYLWKVE